jgi:Domain of unknown function (DUF4274)
MDEEELWIEHQIAWLKDASPEDWHRVALDFNWDNPIDPLFWIVRQPECDRATALTIFWLAQPSYRLMQSAEDDGESHAASDWKMVQFIGDRINAKGYVRSGIAFDATPLLLQDYDELVAEGKKAPDVPLKAHPDMKRSIRGREVRLDRDFYERYPEEFHGSVMIDLPETNIVTPYMKSARSEVAASIVNLLAVGCMTAFLAEHGLPKPSNLIIWIVAISGICWCLFSSRSSLQTFKGIVRAEHLPMPLFWIRTTTILSLFFGAGLGLAYRHFFIGQVQALIENFGVVATITAGLVVILPSLWLVASGYARILVDRTFR